jgi:Rhomboid family
MNALRDFLQKNGILGYTMVILSAFFVLQFVATLLIAALQSTIPMAFAEPYFALSARRFLSNPWTILSYPFVYQAHTFSGVLSFFVDLVFLWSFGNIFRSMWQEARLRQFIFIFVPLLGLIGLLISLVYPAGGSLMTAAPVIFALVFAVAVLLPDYPINLWGAVQMKLIFFAVLALLIEMTNVKLGLTGVMTLVGAALGGFSTYQMKKGNDWLSIIYEKISSLRHRPSPTKNTPAAPKKPEHAGVSQAEIDRILEKIHEKGFAALSAQEKEMLESFSGKRKGDN